MKYTDAELDEKTPKMWTPDCYKAERILAGRTDFIFLLDQMRHQGNNETILITFRDTVVDCVKAQHLVCAPIDINQHDFCQSATDFLVASLGGGRFFRAAPTLMIDLCWRRVVAEYPFVMTTKDFTVDGWKITTVVRSEP